MILLISISNYTERGFMFYWNKKIWQLLQITFIIIYLSGILLYLTIQSQFLYFILRRWRLTFRRWKPTWPQHILLTCKFCTSNRIIFQQNWVVVIKQENSISSERHFWWEYWNYMISSCKSYTIYSLEIDLEIISVRGCIAKILPLNFSINM
jgi:hypothetical protein